MQALQMPRMLGPSSMFPGQVGSIPGMAPAQNNGLDLSNLMATMIPMMIVVMMMGMMMKTMGGVTGESPAKK